MKNTAIIAFVVLLLAGPALAADKPPLRRVKGPEGFKVVSVVNFREGVACVSYYGPGGYRRGFIDARGNWVVKPLFREAGLWSSEGLMRVKEGNAWRFFNKKGKAPVTVREGWVDDFHDGHAAFARTRLFGLAEPLWGYVDKAGKVVVEPTYDFAGQFQEGVARLKSGAKWGLINSQRNLVLPVVEESVRLLGDGVVEVYRGGKAAFVDHQGRALTPAPFAGTLFLDGGFGIGVLPDVKPEMRVIVDRQGQVHGPKRTGYTNEFHEGLVAFHENKRYGYARSDGTVAIEPRFDFAVDFHDGLAAVQLGGKWGYVDPTGTLVIPARFDRAGNFEEDLAGAQEGDRTGYIDRAGAFRIDLGAPGENFGAL